MGRHGYILVEKYGANAYIYSVKSGKINFYQNKVKKYLQRELRVI